MKYRADIEGLRAVSVILVILYHLGISNVPGGFIGVDVFFVTSGYLISGILLRALQTDTFSLMDFYERRARRIVPALLLLVTATLVGGYVLLFPGDFKVASNSALHALLAIGNVFFYLNTGYFDGAAELAPLLHTWSLGVEEQFYFVWPLLLAFAYRIFGGRIDRLRLLIIAVIAASFAFNLWETKTNPTAAFYLPWSRAWELALGALLVLTPPIPDKAWRWLPAETLALTGIALIAWSGLSLSSKQPYPGVDALFPVVGAALLLYQSGGRTLVGRLLSLAPMTYVGKMSYSLYLWHWPLIVYGRHYVNGAPFTPAEMAIIASLTVIAAWLSWRLVEAPFRHSRLSQRAVFGATSAGTAAIAMFAATIFVANGMPHRLPAANQALADKSVMWEWACPQEADLSFPNFYNTDLPQKPCVLGADWKTAEVRGFLWGDSNSQHLYPLLHATAQKEGIAIATIAPCPAIIHESKLSFSAPSMPYYNKNCSIQRDAVLNYIQGREDVSLIILATSWSTLPGQVYEVDSDPRTHAVGMTKIRKSFDDLIPRLSAPNRRIVLFADFPNILASNQIGGGKLTDPVACMLATTALPRRSCDLDHLARNYARTWGKYGYDLLKSVAETNANVVSFVPADYLCNEDNCMTSFNGEFLYRDSNHIRRNLKQETVELLAEKLELSLLLNPADTSIATASTGTTAPAAATSCCSSNRTRKLASRTAMP